MARGRQGHVNGFAANGLTKSRGAAPTAVLLDPEGLIGRLYAAKTTPHMFIVDAEGKLGVRVYVEPLDRQPTETEGALTSVEDKMRFDWYLVGPNTRPATRQFQALRRFADEVALIYKDRGEQDLADAAARLGSADQDALGAMLQRIRDQILKRVEDDQGSGPARNHERGGQCGNLQRLPAVLVPGPLRARR